MSIRLIDTSTFQMRVFVGEKIPNYAILSHTWVDDEEVDFQEMTAIACDPRHPATLKPGYTKIRFTCEEARRHNIKYVWVDTCTIDKSSSTELSEAINSMFKWYRNAEVCYVFLSDLEPGVDVEEAMKSCRWYKRGWTLQELIAPENLRFYNRIWEFVGTKSDLKSTVSAITGVDQVVLMDCTVLPEFPLARRMSWASQRTTTRTEDLAYCLLGIFDVNMPLLYGEGNKAFIRLQEEIIKHSNDLSIFWNFPCTTTGSIEGLGFYPGRDLFATTPRDFSESGDIVPRTLAVGFKREFALTNNGVRFATAKFKVLLLRGYYVMDLQHTYGRSQDCLMALQKIGPGVFVRLAISLEKCWRGSPALVDSLNPCENEDAYVVSKISASIEEQMHTCRRHALRFEIHEEGRERYRRIIEVPTPHENWNSAHQEFITMGQPSKETRFGIDNGCLPVEAKAPYFLPLSLDLVYRGFKANSEQRLLSLFSEFYDTLGPNIEQSLLGTTGFVTMDPVNVEAILSSRFDDIGSGPRRNSFWALLGDGIFTQDGTSWKRSREILRRQFVRMQYQSLEVFNEHVDNLVDVIKGAPDIVDLQPIFFKYTLDITTALIFNQSVSALRNEGRDLFSEGFGYAANVTAMRARLGDFYWLHTPRRFVKACKDVKMYADAFIAQALSNARAGPGKATSNQQQKLAFITDLFDELKDPEKVRDQLINVLLAGRDTTACLMTWAVRLLVRHPHTLKRLQAEIFDVAGNQIYMTRAHIKKMTFLRHVLKETLRLYPPVPINLRFANKATIMPRGGGPDGNAPVLIRKGMSMTYSPYHMHRRRDLWGDDALEFNPERWADRALTESKWIKWAYLPFNGGPRVCLGMDMAVMEASYGLARIIQAFPNLAMPPGTTIEPLGTERQALTLVLASGDGCKVVK